MKRHVITALVAMLPTVALAQMPSGDEIKDTAKTGAFGAVEGGKASAADVAKDPSAAKKDMKGTAKKVATSAGKGAVKAVKDKHNAMTASTTTTETNAKTEVMNKADAAGNVVTAKTTTTETTTKTVVKAKAMNADDTMKNDAAKAKNAVPSVP